MSANQHPLEALHELLDGRLDEARRAEVEAHLAGCAECRDEWAQISSLRATLRETMTPAPVPDDLVAGLRVALDREAAAPAAPAMPAPESSAPPRRSLLRPAVVWAGVAAAVLVAAIYVALQAPPPTLPEEVSEVYATYVTSRPPLGLATADAAELQRYFDEHLSYGIHVYDLGMMGYRLVGGRIDRLAGRESAVFVYEDAEGRTILCHMFLGGVDELPVGAELRTHNGIPFYIYQRDGRTLVFWPEGQVICVLTSDLPAEAVIELAFAKAVKI